MARPCAATDFPHTLSAFERRLSREASAVTAVAPAAHDALALWVSIVNATVYELVTAHRFTPMQIHRIARCVSSTLLIITHPPH